MKKGSLASLYSAHTPPRPQGRPSGGCTNSLVLFLPNGQSSIQFIQLLSSSQPSPSSSTPPPPQPPPPHPQTTTWPRAHLNHSHSHPPHINTIITKVVCTSQTCEVGQGATLPSALSVAPSSYGLPASPIHATAAPSPPNRMLPIPPSTQTALEPFVSQSSFHDMFHDAFHDILVY